MNNEYFEIDRDNPEQLTRHFNSKEFVCHCGKCKNNKISKELVVALEKLRIVLGQPVHINSAFRCREHNKKVGGKNDSQHLLGNATDIRSNEISPVKLAIIASKMGFEAFGIYNSFVHVDIRKVATAKDIIVWEG